MSKLGKKILSAFIEVTPAPGDQKTDSRKSSAKGPGPSMPGPTRAESYGHLANDDRQASSGSSVAGNRQASPGTGGHVDEQKFSEYFDMLFSEANIPGPDYFEFSKMTEAMQAIPDEQARFHAAFAGLQVQGLDKQKLLSTADEYLRVLEADASHFRATVDQAMQEKVHGRSASLQEKTGRIQSLAREISDLQNQVLALQAEIKENQAKIEASTGGYAAESGDRKVRVLADIEKIKQYIH